jgi:hypothetical protein
MLPVCTLKDYDNLEKGQVELLGAITVQLQL